MVAMAAAACVGRPLHAQSSTESAPLLLELPANGRAASMGGAFGYGTADTDVLFYNPAWLSDAQGGSLSVARYGSASTLFGVTAAREWSGGTIAIGVQVLTYGSAFADLTDPFFNETALLQSGPVGASAAAVSLGFGREFGAVRLGVTTKVVEQRLAGADDHTGAVDVGIGTEIGDVNLGLVAQNLGPGLEIGASGRPLPHNVTAAASHSSIPIGPLDLVTAIAVTRLRDGEFVPRGGIEVSYWPVVGRTFRGRFGVQRVPHGEASPVTFGLAFTGDNITIEYAFQTFDAPENAHRFGFRWR